MSVSTAAPSRRSPSPEHGPTPLRRERGRHLRVAPDARRRRRRVRLAMWGAGIVTVASLFVLVGFHVVAVQYAFQLDQLTEQRVAEERRYERLRYDVAMRSSPAAVVEAARTLGLVPATEVRYLAVQEPMPPTNTEDRTEQTLVQSWDEAKSSLEP